MKKIGYIICGIIIVLGLIYMWLIQPFIDGDFFSIAVLIALVVMLIVHFFTKEKGEE